MAKLYSVEEVAEIIEAEGIGYAVQEYLNPNSIEDEKLAKLWKQAQDILKEIETLTNC